MVQGEHSAEFYACGDSATLTSSSVVKVNQDGDIDWELEINGDDTDTCRGVYYDQDKDLMYALIETLSTGMIHSDNSLVVSDAVIIEFGSNKDVKQGYTISWLLYDMVMPYHSLGGYDGYIYFSG
jgi:hypothetical protein